MPAAAAIAKTAANVAMSRETRVEKNNSGPLVVIFFTLFLGWAYLSGRLPYVWAALTKGGFGKVEMVTPPNNSAQPAKPSPNKRVRVYIPPVTPGASGREVDITRGDTTCFNLVRQTAVSLGWDTTRAELLALSVCNN